MALFVVQIFKTISEKLVYENKWIKVYENKIIRRGQEGVYGVVRRQDTAVIIPLTVTNKTVLLKQYRYPTADFSWELPMGGILKNESDIEAAKRELVEETGIKDVTLKQIGSFYAIPGLTPQKVAIFVARLTEEELLLKFTPNTQTDDILSGKVLDIKDVYHMVVNGEITDGVTLSSLLYLKLHLK